MVVLGHSSLFPSHGFEFPSHVDVELKVRCDPVLEIKIQHIHVARVLFQYHLDLRMLYWWNSRQQIDAVIMFFWFASSIHHGVDPALGGEFGYHWFPNHNESFVIVYVVGPFLLPISYSRRLLRSRTPYMMGSQ